MGLRIAYDKIWICERGFVIKVERSLIVKIPPKATTVGQNGFSFVADVQTLCWVKVSCSIGQGCRNSYNLIDCGNRKEVLYVLKKGPWF